MNFGLLGNVSISLLGDSAGRSDLICVHTTNQLVGLVMKRSVFFSIDFIFAIDILPGVSSQLLDSSYSGGLLLAAHCDDLLLWWCDVADQLNFACSTRKKLEKRKP